MVVLALKFATGRIGASFFSTGIKAVFVEVPFSLITVRLTVKSAGYPYTKTGFCSTESYFPLSLKSHLQETAFFERSVNATVRGTLPYVVFALKSASGSTGSVSVPGVTRGR